VHVQTDTASPEGATGISSCGDESILFRKFRS